MPTLVDPRLGAALRTWRRRRGLSLRDLAQLVHHGKSYLCDVESGARRAGPDLAARLDAILDTGGALAALCTLDGPLAHALTHSGTTAAAAAHQLASTLATYRTLDDELGPAAVLPATVDHLDIIGRLLRHAAGPPRTGLVGVAAQWAQFGGWLHLATGRRDQADRLLGRAVEWAVEAGDREMIATALSFRAHAAWLYREPGPLVGLTEAALRDSGVYIGERAYDHYQLARGYALLGDRRAAEETLAAAHDLADEAAEHAGPRPPWHYYRSRAHYTLEAGLSALVLGQHGRAAELLAEGLGGLPAELRDAEWTGQYRRALEDALSAA